MREIEFRAWLKDKKKMVEVDTIDFEGQYIMYKGQNEERVFRFKDIVLMQFIGLEDDNGKGIYEGDIVIVNVKGRNTICKVAWANSVAHFQLWQINTIPNTPTALDFGNYTCKVIGNSYENKELTE